MINERGDFAGFLRRFVATVLDIVFSTIAIVVMFILFSPSVPEDLEFSGDAMDMLVDQGPESLLYVLYFVLLTASPLRGTFGKFVLDSAVVDGEGRTIGVARGVWRELMKFFSALPLLLGYFMAGFTPQKRALHDYLSGTYVVRASEWPVESRERGAFGKALNWGVAMLLVALTVFMYVQQHRLVEHYAAQQAEESRIEHEREMQEVAETRRKAKAEPPRPVKDYSALSLLAEKVEAHAVSKQKFPSQFTEIGVSMRDFLDGGVKKASIGKNGVVHVSFDPKSSVGDVSIVMAPYVDDAGYVKWSCRSMQLADHELPDLCER